MLDALTSTVVPIAILAEATFRTGTVYLWSGMGPLNWNGQTWQGVGALGSISPIEEGSTVEAKGVTITLSGFDPTLLPDVLNEFALLQPVNIYLACFNGGAIIADPLLAFSGRMDQPMIEVGQSAKISINCETDLLDLNVATDRRYTQDDQQMDWPGDLGMNFVPAIQEITIYWGSAPIPGQNI